YESLPTVRYLRRRCHVARGDFGTGRADQDKSPCPAATTRRMENCDCNQFAVATGEPARNSAGQLTSQPDRIWREAATRFDRWPKFRRFIGRAPATARHSVRDDLSRRGRTCTGRETRRTAELAAGRRFDESRARYKFALVNITTGQDLYQDSVFNTRAAFGTCTPGASG